MVLKVQVMINLQVYHRELQTKVITDRNLTFTEENYSMVANLDDLSLGTLEAVLACKAFVDDLLKI